MFKVWYDGAELTRLFRVESVSRGLLPSRSNNSKKVGNTTGRTYINGTFEHKVIPVKIRMLSDNLVRDRELLAGMLYKKEPKKLVFSDEPLKYWLAIIDGSTNIDELFTLGKGTLYFVCFEPFKFSNSTKTVQVSGDTIELENEGTAPTPVKITADFGSDNGVFSVISPDSIIQVGEPEEVDEVPVEKSILSISDRMNNLTGWTTNPPGVKPFHSRGGSLAVGTMKGDATESFVYPSSFGTGTKWHGPLIRHDVTSTGAWDGLNWEAEFYFRFDDPYAEKTGTLEMAFTDDSGEQVISVLFINSSVRSSKNHVFIHVEGVEVYRDMTSWDWQTFLGKVKIWKFGNEYKIQLYNMNKKKERTIKYEHPTGTRPVSKLQIWFGQWGTQKAMLWPDMGMSEVRVVAHKAEHMEDVPNQFTTGERLEIDTATAKVKKGTTEEGAPLLPYGNVDVGSKFFMIEPGITELRFLWSSFATTPTIKIETRERWF